MKSPLDDLTSKDVQLVRAYADSNMRVVAAADLTGLNESTVRRRLSSIYKKSKLDPRRFKDLMQLVLLICGEEYGTDT